MTVDEYNDFDKWLWHQIRSYTYCLAHSSAPDKENSFAARRLKLFQEDKEGARKLWEEQREHYAFEDKQMDITKTLEALKACGFVAQLANFDNRCITAKSKSGKNMTYYAGTGTIQGYGNTHIKGIDNFIKLLSEI